MICSLVIIFVRLLKISRVTRFIDNISVIFFSENEEIVKVYSFSLMEVSVGEKQRFLVEIKNKFMVLNNIL